MLKATPEVLEKIAKVKRPPFDFEIPDYLEDEINALIKCLEEHDFVQLDIYEDAVHGSARSVKDPENEIWIMDYYSNKGWLYDD